MSKVNCQNVEEKLRVLMDEIEKKKATFAGERLNLSDNFPKQVKHSMYPLDPSILKDTNLVIENGMFANEETPESLKLKEQVLKKYSEKYLLKL